MKWVNIKYIKYPYSPPVVGGSNNRIANCGFTESDTVCDSGNIQVTWDNEDEVTLD
jgi:hypothetical protein